MGVVWGGSGFAFLAKELLLAEAATAVHTVAGGQISGRHVQRFTQEVGTDLGRLRDAKPCSSGGN